MKKYLIVLLLFLLSGCAGFWPFGERDDFVIVQGTQFIYNDEPYYFLGTNMWYAPYIGSPSSTGDRPRLLRELDSLQSIGITNIRILAGSERSGMPRTLAPSITAAPGEYDDSLLLGLDFTLLEMSKRKMKGVLFLTNYWEWSGGMAQYVTWADSLPPFDTDADGWDLFMDYSASFYQNETAKEYFRDYIQKIITRKNVYSGRQYNEDPTIMSWQLANEPRPGTISPFGFENVPYFLRWIDETAGFIKSLDTNHLVSTGSEGIIGSLQNEEIYLSAHSSPHIDYMTVHLWPGIWRWFNHNDEANSLLPAIDSSKSYIARNIAAARIAGKPLVLEEFGIGRDSGSASIDAPTTVRDQFMAAMFSMVYDSARAGAPIAGTNFWGWGGEGRALNTDYFWKPGDPFTADPAHERQGMHSIFNTDSATIKILYEHARKMKELGKVVTGKNYD
jgi:mannan endo-1,4-beta-mannosidase